MYRYFILCLLPTFSLAEVRDDGVTNPMEMAILDQVNNKASIATCTAGYYLTKAGVHDPSIQIFENCAKSGMTQAMTWLSYMYQNARGGEERPDLAAYWDEQAALAGDEVGMMNFGLDLLRGYGVEQDLEAAQVWIDRAADAGLKSAIHLRNSGYNVLSATPDTDENAYHLH